MQHILAININVRLTQWLIGLIFHNLRITKFIYSLHGPLNHQINPKQMSFVLYKLTFMTSMGNQIGAYDFELYNYKMLHGARSYRRVVSSIQPLGSVMTSESLQLAALTLQMETRE